ncbi:MAG: phosphatase PAP2 family protein [Planctomycetota bacterium]
MNETEDPAREQPARASELLRLRWPILLALAALPAHIFDAEFVRALNPDRPFALDSTALWFDHSSTRSLLAFFFVLFFLGFGVRRLRHWRLPATAFAMAWICEQLIVGVLKRVVARPRPIHPDGILESLRPLFDHADLKSFPSGHSGTAFCCALLISLWARRPLVTWIALSFAGLVAISRSYVGAHYLSDILFGAAVGWATAIVGWKAAVIARRNVEILEFSFGQRCLFLLAAPIAFGWLFQSPLELLLYPAAPELQLVSRPTAFSLLTEPVTGPALEVASWPELRIFLYAGALWSMVIALALAFFAKRRGILAAAVMLVMAVVIVALALTGQAFGPRLSVEKSPGAASCLVADFQSHLDDPVDGAQSMASGLKRFETAGFSYVQPTWHNRWVEGRVLRDGKWEKSGIFGMEWSGGAPTESVLHLLIFSRDAKPADLGSEASFSRLLSRAAQAGAVVYASHAWRGDEGGLRPLFEPANLARLTGVEIAGRHQEIASHTLKRQEALRALAKEHGLKMLTDSDFHGKRSANSHWNLILMRDGESDVDAVWAALSDRERKVTTVAADRPFVWPTANAWLRPPLAVLRYSRGLTLAQRCSWFAWLGLAFLVLGLWKRRGRVLESRRLARRAI